MAHRSRVTLGPRGSLRMADMSVEREEWTLSLECIRLGGGWSLDNVFYSIDIISPAAQCPFHKAIFLVRRE